MKTVIMAALDFTGTISRIVFAMISLSLILSIPLIWVYLVACFVMWEWIDITWQMLRWGYAGLLIVLIATYVPMGNAVRKRVKQQDHE